MCIMLAEYIVHSHQHMCSQQGPGWNPTPVSPLSPDAEQLQAKLALIHSVPRTGARLPLRLSRKVVDDGSRGDGLAGAGRALD